MTSSDSLVGLPAGIGQTGEQLPAYDIAGQSEGIPFGGYTRLVGAPNYAPSLRSVAGLLLALVLESRYEDTPPSLPRRLVTAPALAPNTARQIEEIPRAQLPHSEPARLARGRRSAPPPVGTVTSAARCGAHCARVRTTWACARDSKCMHLQICVGRRGCPRRRFSKRARGGDPRPSGARERS